MSQNAAVYSRGSTQALIGVLLLGLFLNTFAIDWGIPNIHSWNPDDIAPAKPLRVVQTYTHGWDKYPFLQSWIDFVAFAPLLFYWSINGTFQPGCESNIETCFRDPYGQVSILLILSRLISALMAAGAVYWTYRISLLAFQDRLAAVLGALVLTCSNVFVFSAHVGTVDVPYLFWFTWSIYHYLRIVETNQTKNYIAFGFLSACALATKEQVVGAYLVIGIVIYVFHVRRMLDNIQTMDIRSVMKIHMNIRLVGLVVLLFFTYGLINNVFFNWNGYVKHFTHWVGTAAAGITPYAKSELGYTGLLKEFVIHVKAGMSDPLMLLGLAGALYGLSQNVKGALLLIITGISYYIFTIQSVQYSLIRFGLPVVVLLAIFGGVLGARFCRVQSSWRWFCFPAIILILSYGLLKSVNVVLVMRNDSRYLTERWLINNVARTTQIAVLSVPTYLPRFGLLGYEVDRIPRESASVEYVEKLKPQYLVVTSKYYSGFRGKQKEFVDALFSGRLNYRRVWDYKYESPLKSIVGDWYISGFVNPRITVFKHTAISP